MRVEHSAGQLVPARPLVVEPRDYFRVKTVHSFAELIGTPFADGVNALCWPRALSGDFSEVVEKLGGGDGEEVVTIDEEQLAGLAVSAGGRAAIEVLRDAEAAPRRETAAYICFVHYATVAGNVSSHGVARSF